MELGASTSNEAPNRSFGIRAIARASISLHPSAHRKTIQVTAQQGSEMHMICGPDAGATVALL